MNGVPLPRDHGSPLRVIVPGYAAVRNVKWVEKIEVSKEEAEGPWQRGLNYKTLPPGVVDANEVRLEEMPSITEQSVYSGITTISRTTSEALNLERTHVRRAAVRNQRAPRGRRGCVDNVLPVEANRVVRRPGQAQPERSL